MLWVHGFLWSIVFIVPTVHTFDVSIEKSIDGQHNRTREHVDVHRGQQYRLALFKTRYVHIRMSFDDFQNELVKNRTMIGFKIQFLSGNTAVVDIRRQNLAILSTNTTQDSSSVVLDELYIGERCSRFYL
jgi:hypothetical protein